MRLLAMILLCLGIASPCFANDGAVVGEGGRVRLLDGEHPSVRMVRERVRIDVYAGHYDVDVNFVFRNEGPPVAVTMGFPEMGGGDIGAERYKDRSAFLRFATWVDGQRVSARRRQAVIDADYHAFWVKKVGFREGQQRSVTVRYSSTPGGDISGNSFVTYLFAGSNWRGTVDETTLTVELHIPGTHIVSVGARAKREGNRFSQRWTNWQGEGQFTFGYWPMPVPSGWMRIEGLAGSFGPYGEEEITVPGRQGGRTWNPPALLVNGATFVRVDALKNFLYQQAEQAGQARAAALSWDSAKKEAALQAGSHILVFRPGGDEMLVSPDRKVRLPAAPFLSQPAPMHRGGALYVPARPVVEALGGTLRTDLSARRVDLDIPPFWSAEGKSAN